MFKAQTYTYAQPYHKRDLEIVATAQMYDAGGMHWDYSTESERNEVNVYLKKNYTQLKQQNIDCLLQTPFTNTTISNKKTRRNWSGRRCW